MVFMCILIMYECNVMASYIPHTSILSFDVSSRVPGDQKTQLIARRNATSIGLMKLTYSLSRLVQLKVDLRS